MRDVRPQPVQKVLNYCLEFELESEFSSVFVCTNGSLAPSAPETGKLEANLIPGDCVYESRESCRPHALIESKT